MDNIEKTVYKGLKKYVNTLTLVGYIKDIEMERMLVACFLNSLRYDLFILPEGEERLIYDKLKELSVCSCLIPCMTKYTSSLAPSISSDETLRVREDGTTAQNYEDEFMKMFE